MPRRERRPAPRTQANRPEVIQRRSEIVGRYKSGQSLKRISREMGLDIKTVRLWVRREEGEGHVNTRPRPGRPQVTTPEEDQRLFAAVEQTPLTNAARLQRELHLDCNISTIRRRLHNHGVDCHVPANKENLNDDR